MFHRQHRLLLILLVGALGISPSRASASSFTFKSLNSDGTVPATPQAINASDQIVGITQNSKGVSVGFVWSAGTLTVVDGSGILNSINDAGMAVGAPWLDEKNYYVSYNVQSAKLTDVPISIGLHGGQFVGATGVNASGDVVGVSVAGSGTKFVGFMMANGQSTKVLPPQQKQSVPAAINDAGDIIINCACYAVDYNPYVYRRNKFKQIAVPGASIATANFMTSGGIIGGSFTSGSVTSGFILRHGNYLTYSPSGATSSTVSGVGPSGQVYGSFVDSSGNTHGFVNVGDVFYQIDVPSSTFTEILGVGKSGSIYGLYRSNGGAYGYIGTCRKKDVCTQ